MTTFLNKSYKTENKSSSSSTITKKESKATIDSFIETLNSVIKYQNDYLELGVKRVDEYVESVEDNWLENW